MDQSQIPQSGAPSINSAAGESEGLTAFSHDTSTPSFSEAFESEVNYQLEKGISGVSAYHSSDEIGATIPPEHGFPGLAPESVLQRGLQVPTRSRTITSGFKYPQTLSRANVSEEDWAAFTSDITRIAQMDAGQWTTTIGKGVGTFFVGGLLVGFFGALPAAMVAKKVRERIEAKNLDAARSGGEESELQLVIERWNTSFFRPKGLMVRVDLPGEFEDMSEMDVSTSQLYKQQRMKKAGKSLTGKKVEAAEQSEKFIRRSASHRGRIVILPLNENLISETSSTSPEGRRTASFTQPLPGALTYEERTGKKDYYPNEPKP